MSITPDQRLEAMEMTTRIVVALIETHRLGATEAAKSFTDVATAILTVADSEGVKAAQPVNTPAVDPKKSVKDDVIICLEDGKAFKSLKRHIMAHYGLSPDEYRAKWGLPPSYPMVAPNYAATRSQLAKDMGLGRKKGEARPQ